MNLSRPAGLPSFALASAFLFAGLALHSGGTHAQTTPSKNLASGFAALPVDAKIVLMPVDVELCLLSAGGVPVPKTDWTSSVPRRASSN